MTLIKAQSFPMSPVKLMLKTLNTTMFFFCCGPPDLTVKCVVANSVFCNYHTSFDFVRFGVLVHEVKKLVNNFFKDFFVVC